MLGNAELNESTRMRGFSRSEKKKKISKFSARNLYIVHKLSSVSGVYYLDESVEVDFGRSHSRDSTYELNFRTNRRQYTRLCHVTSVRMRARSPLRNPSSPMSLVRHLPCLQSQPGTYIATSFIVSCFTWSEKS